VESLSALEIAEQMTYLDHQIFIAIRSEYENYSIYLIIPFCTSTVTVHKYLYLFSISKREFLGQAWTKENKDVRAPHITLMTRRFNDLSRLVVSEIIRQPSQAARLQTMEKWTAVGDICRVLHNFNGVLQICAAFTNSAVYRLKKTNEKLSKTV